MVIGFVFQVAVRDLYPIPIGRILESSGCTSFYTVTTLYGPLDLIQQFESLAPSLPLHASYNMPGKTFIYYFLELFSARPETLALGMLALSTARRTVFAVASGWPGTPRVATLAMVLSLVFPASRLSPPAEHGRAPGPGPSAPGRLSRYPQSRYLWLLGASRI